MTALIAERFANNGRMLVATLMGRLGLVISWCIVFWDSLYARRSTSEDVSDSTLLSVALFIVEGLVAFVSDSVKRSTAKVVVTAMSSSSSVLNIMCDAMVQLGERLMLATSSSKLDVLLLRLPKDDPESFVSLHDVTYQGRFVEFATRSDHVVQSLHVKFRGDFDLCLRAQLYASKM